MRGYQPCARRRTRALATWHLLRFAAYFASQYAKRAKLVRSWYFVNGSRQRTTASIVSLRDAFTSYYVYSNNLGYRFPTQAEPIGLGRFPVTAALVGCSTGRAFPSAVI